MGQGALGEPLLSVPMAPQGEPQTPGLAKARLAQPEPSALSCFRTWRLGLSAAGHMRHVLSISVPEIPPEPKLPLRGCGGLSATTQAEDGGWGTVLGAHSQDHSAAAGTRGPGTGPSAPSWSCLYMTRLLTRSRRPGPAGRMAGYAKGLSRRNGDVSCHMTSPHICR